MNQKNINKINKMMGSYVTNLVKPRCNKCGNELIRVDLNIPRKLEHQPIDEPYDGETGTTLFHYCEKCDTKK